ncbi:alpha/beta family hydrolase, partial [Streptomyces sp. NPDC005180]
EELLGAGVPVLVVQGGNDPFGKPEEFPGGEYELIEVDSADHGLSVPKRAALSQEEALAAVVDGVRKWITALV